MRALTKWSAQRELPGVGRRERAVATDDLAYVRRRVEMGVDTPEDEALEGFVVDLGQGHNRGGTAAASPTPCITTRTRFYDFSARWGLIGKEYFNLLGQADADVTSLSLHECCDLAGESMSMPMFAVLLLSAVVAADLPRFWAGPRCTLIGPQV